MPEHVSTDNLAVARVLAATELTKAAMARAVGEAQKTPEGVGETYKTIYKAIREALAGR